MDLSGVFGIVALVVAVALLIPLIVGAVFVVVVVANRTEPDLSGRRPALVYALGASFLTLFLTLFATTTFVAELCRLIGSHGSTDVGAFSYTPLDSASGTSAYSSTLVLRLGHQHPLGDSVARGAVLAGIVAIVAGVVCALHLRAAARGSADATRTDPLGRVLSSYIAAVSFVSVFIVLFAVVVVIFDIFRGAAPGVFTSSGHGGSVDVLRSLIPAAFLALAASAILLAHLRFAPPPFRPNVFPGWFGGPPASPPADVPAPETEQ